MKLSDIHLPGIAIWGTTENGKETIFFDNIRNSGAQINNELVDLRKLVDFNINGESFFLLEKRQALLWISKITTISDYVGRPGFCAITIIADCDFITLGAIDKLNILSRAFINEFIDDDNRIKENKQFDFSNIKEIIRERDINNTSLSLNTRNRYSDGTIKVIRQNNIKNTAIALFNDEFQTFLVLDAASEIKLRERQNNGIAVRDFKPKIDKNNQKYIYIPIVVILLCTYLVKTWIPKIKSNIAEVYTNKPPVNADSVTNRISTGTSDSNGRPIKKNDSVKTIRLSRNNDSPRNTDSTIDTVKKTNSMRPSLIERTKISEEPEVKNKLFDAAFNVILSRALTADLQTFRKEAINSYIQNKEKYKKKFNMNYSVLHTINEKKNTVLIDNKLAILDSLYQK